jgi:hypothetical protein
LTAVSTAFTQWPQDMPSTLSVTFVISHISFALLF